MMMCFLSKQQSASLTLLTFETNYLHIISMSFDKQNGTYIMRASGVSKVYRLI